MEGFLDLDGSERGCKGEGSEIASKVEYCMDYRMYQGCCVRSPSDSSAIVRIKECMDQGALSYGNGDDETRGRTVVCNDFHQSDTGLIVSYCTTSQSECTIVSSVNQTRDGLGTELVCTHSFKYS